MASAWGHLRVSDVEWCAQAGGTRAPAGRGRPSSGPGLALWVPVFQGLGAAYLSSSPSCPAVTHTVLRPEPAPVMSLRGHALAWPRNCRRVRLRAVLPRCTHMCVRLVYRCTNTHSRTHVGRSCVHTCTEPSSHRYDHASHTWCGLGPFWTLMCGHQDQKTFSFFFPPDTGD